MRYADCKGRYSLWNVKPNLCGRCAVRAREAARGALRHYRGTEVIMNMLLHIQR